MSHESVCPLSPIFASPKNQGRLPSSFFKHIRPPSSLGLAVHHTQVTLTSAYLGEDTDVDTLSGALGSLISAQISGIVVGQNPDEVSSDYFRLSTGVYDAAAVGGVQVPRFTVATARSASSNPILAGIWHRSRINNDEDAPPNMAMPTTFCFVFTFPLRCDVPAAEIRTFKP